MSIGTRRGFWPLNLSRIEIMASTINVNDKEPFLVSGPNRTNEKWFTVACLVNWWKKNFPHYLSDFPRKTGGFPPRIRRITYISSYVFQEIRVGVKQRRGPVILKPLHLTKPANLVNPLALCINRAGFVITK
jgi:hypothetical protein